MTNISVEDLIKRVEKLERAVFVGERKSGGQKKKLVKSDYSGATGGVRLLVDNGFFDRKRSSTEVKIELEKRGYHYSAQAVQMPLMRLSKVGGPLVSLSGEGKIAYAKRK